MGWLAQLSADGHTAYVVAAFAIAGVLLAAELLLLHRRWRAAAGPRP